MNTSDTPETDHLEDQLGSAAKFSHPIIWRHARQLERQRDEVREQLIHLRSCVYDVIHSLKAGAFYELEKAWKEGLK